VQSIDGEPAPRTPDGPVATLFLAEDGGLGGTVLCNGGGSGYARWERNGGFTHMEGPFIFTAMGCGDDDPTRFADRFWTLMGDAVRWRRLGDELIIESSGGAEARLRLIEERR
jgi:heat shock protein HslJ